MCRKHLAAQQQTFLDFEKRDNYFASLTCYASPLSIHSKNRLIKIFYDLFTTCLALLCAIHRYCSQIRSISDVAGCDR